MTLKRNLFIFATCAFAVIQTHAVLQVIRGEVSDSGQITIGKGSFTVTQGT
jgi:hypothetical protein